jgi:hypothetical protein
MSDELLQLGLDTESIRKELDRLSVRFEKSMARNAKATEKVGKAATAMNRAIRGIAGFVGFRQLASTALHAGDTIDEATKRFVAGSERLRRATNIKGDAGEMREVAAEVEDFSTRAKLTFASMVTDSIQGWKQGIAYLKGGSAGMNQERAKQAAAKTTGPGVAATKSVKDIAAKEDEISAMAQKGVVTDMQRYNLAGKRLELANLELEAASNATKQDRQAINAAKQKQGAAVTEMNAIVFQQKAMIHAAEQTNKATDAELKGQQQLADTIRLRADYAQKLAVAMREGKPTKYIAALYEELKLAEKKAAIAETERRYDAALADSQAKGIGYAQEQLEMQAKITRNNRELQRKDLTVDRIAELKKENREIVIQMEEKSAAHYAERRNQAATIEAIGLEMAGYKNIAEQRKIAHELDEQILEANRTNNKELAKSLTIQKNLATAAARVAEHNMTSKERRDERRVARKFARDKKKTDAQDEAMKKTAARMAAEGHKATPGSRLDRYIQSQSPDTPILERIAKAVEKPPQAPQNAR